MSDSQQRVGIQVNDGRRTHQCKYRQQIRPVFFDIQRIEAKYNWNQQDSDSCSPFPECAGRIYGINGTQYRHKKY